MCVADRAIVRSPSLIFPNSTYVIRSLIFTSEGRSEHGRARARVTLPSPVAPPQLSDLPRPHVCVVRVWQPDPTPPVA